MASLEESSQARGPGAPGKANLEIKARCTDLGAARAVAGRLGAVRLGLDRQIDTYFVTVEEPEALRTLLSTLLGVHRVVRKEREIFLHENVRIHLDRVEGLGSFLELEAVFDGTPAEEAAQQAKVDFLMAELGIAEGDLLETSYEGLVAEEPARS